MNMDKMDMIHETANMNRKEPVQQKEQFWIDSRGIRRNSLLNRHLNRLTIDVLDHGYFVGTRKWNQYDVLSPFGRIYYMIKDRGWLETDLGNIDLVPGFMYLIPPYTRVNLRTNQRIEKFYIHFSMKYSGVEILEGINKCFVLPLGKELLAGVLQAFAGGDIPDLLQFQGITCATLSGFIRSGLPDLDRRLVLAGDYKEIFNYIEDNLSAQLSAHEICRVLGYSYETMRRRFRQDNGVTIKQYLNGRLIQKAAMVLLQSEKTVQEIAASLGYSDEFYFSRVFKKKMEYSPREYRRINAIVKNY